MIKSITRVFAAALLFVTAGSALAHTTSIGYVPGTNPGEVTFWTGSYTHGITPVNEGTLTLTGVGSTVYGPVTVAFDITPTSVKPAGLIDGTNNFYWTNAGPLDPSLTTDPGIGGGVVWWQGVTFTGLAPGDYSFTCGATCGTTAQWDSWDTGAGTVTLVSGDIGGTDVPEPGILSLMGLGLLGLVARRRKQA